MSAKDDKPDQLDDSPYITGIAKGLRPPVRMAILDWMEKHAVFPHSDRNKRFDRGTAPWLSPVIDIFPNNDNHLIVVRGPVGSSKTTLFEALHQYILVEEPGPTMTITQSDDDTTDWVETRLMKCLEGNRLVDPLWPKERRSEKIRKDKHVWGHMWSLFGGANINNLQSKSIRWGLGDEVWLWKQGRVRELEGRFHDRWNRRLLLVSQGAKEDSDFSAKWKTTDQRIRSFTCPKCKVTQEYKWSQVKWDTFHVGDDPFADHDWKRIAASARYECSGCGNRWNDTPIERRKLSSLGFYVGTNPNALEGCIGFHWNAVSIYWIPLLTLINEWIVAIEAKKKGNAELFWQFKQKRLAEDEVTEAVADYGDLILSDYELSDYENGELVDGEVLRFMTNDRQLNHFWSTIRAWRADGSSRLLFTGRLNTRADVKLKAAQYGIAKKKVTVDAQYDTPNVYKMCAEEGWTALHGSKEKGFAHYRGRGKQAAKELRFVSHVDRANLGGGIYCQYMFFAASRIKDILTNLRTGNGAKWELPATLPKEYVDQIDSEAKRRFIDKRTQQEIYDYVKIKADNHLYDTEVHQTVLAYTLGLLGGPVSDEEETQDEAG